MKKFIALLMAGAMATSLAACGGSSSSTAPAASTATAGGDAASTAPAAAVEGLDDLPEMKLIGGDNSSLGAAANTYGERVTALVSELSGGKLTVDYYGLGTLGSDGEQAQQVLDGDMDFLICQTAPLVTFVPESAIFDLPMVFATSDMATIDTALNDSEFATAIRDAYATHNLKVVYYLQGGTYRQTSSNKDLTTLADFSGLKIRTMENSNHQAFWSALGAAPTPLTWSEVYVSLQQGLIEAEENATDTMYGANLQEVQKYLARTNHLLYLNQLVFNNDKFNSLPQAYQDIFLQAAQQAAAEIAPTLATVDQENAQKMIDAGVTEITYEDSFFDEVLALDGVQALYKSIDEQVGGGMVQMLQDALA